MHFSSNFSIFTGFSLLQMDTQALDQSFFLDSTSSSNFHNPWIPTPLCTSMSFPSHSMSIHYKSFQTILLICFLTFVKILIEVNLDSLPYHTHHLGISYYVNFLGRLGGNGFRLKRRFGTHGN